MILQISSTRKQLERVGVELFQREDITHSTAGNYCTMVLSARTYPVRPFNKRPNSSPRSKAYTTPPQTAPTPSTPPHNTTITHNTTTQHHTTHKTTATKPVKIPPLHTSLSLAISYPRRATSALSASLPATALRRALAWRDLASNDDASNCPTLSSNSWRPRRTDALSPSTVTSLNHGAGSVMRARGGGG